MAPCVYFARGHCSFGSTCRNEHAAVSTAHRTASSNRPAPQGSTAAIACTFFARGACTKGPSCPFLHDVEEQTRGDAIPALHQLSLGGIPCKFYQFGACLKANCPYLHTEALRTANAPVVDEDEEKEQDSFVRDIGGARVRFEDGARVMKLSFPMDFSAVRINGLPLRYTPDRLQELLRGLGFEISVENMRLILKQTADETVADITAESPTFATALHEKLNKSPTQGIKCTVVNVPNFTGQDQHRVNSNRVKCSWYKSTRTVWLNFGSQGTAVRVQEKFLSGLYRILEAELRPPLPKSSGGGRGLMRSRGHNPVAWTLMLSNVPGEATRADVERAIIHKHDIPRHIELGPPSYVSNQAESIRIVVAMLQKFGATSEPTVTGGASAKRVKLSIRFVNDDDAARAVKELQSEKLSFTSGRLSIQAVHTVKIKVRSVVFAATEPTITELTSELVAKHVNVSIFPSANGSSKTLKVDGEDLEAVAHGKKELLQIIQGRVAKSGGKAIWSKSLASSRPADHRIRDIKNRTGVHIVLEKPKEQIRLFGSEQNCLEAELLLAALAEADTSQYQHVIDLSTAEFKWICSGGLRAIVDFIGQGNTALDVIPNPKRLTINGTAADFEACQRLVRDQKAPLMQPKAAEGDCAICWTEAEPAIETSCGHIYCAECFESMCAAVGGGNDDFQVRCNGEAARCNKLIPLPELREHLSSVAFEAMLNLSYEQYIRRRPDELRYCPTPDCGYIYRTTTEPNGVTCINCLALICTSCHELHRGMTCAELKDLKSGSSEAFERFKKEHNLKDCPRCKTTMEKTEGCNHMHCQGCKVHLCWVCLATFETSKGCYDHMSEVHGGFYHGAPDRFLD